MTQSFSLTPKQQEANRLLASQATHVLLYGGSRSGKTALLTRAVVMRAIKADASRHAILRFRFNAVKQTIGMDTLPKVMSLCFPGIKYELSKGDWYVRFPHNDSEVWLGGLDDKERAEKILGSEYATIYLNECSQIPWASRNLALTRLAQSAVNNLPGASPLALKMYYDCNPTSKTHWTHKLFKQFVDPDSKRPLANPAQYASMQMNPADNAANLPAGYMQQLSELSARLQRRFLQGEWAEANPQALFREDDLDRWRVMDGRLPDFQRIVVAVDPSGSGDTDNADNDAIGIVVGALGTDGNGYLLEDLTMKGGPASWGAVSTAAYDRHDADCVVGEENYGGAMVNHVIQTARPRTPYRAVRASRGKVVRAEPISSLVEAGKVRLVGYFNDLEEELAGFTTNGYVGEGSPNRADAFVWCFSELFPGLVAAPKSPEPEERRVIDYSGNTGAWMGA